MVPGYGCLGSRFVASGFGTALRTRCTAGTANASDTADSARSAYGLMV